MTKKVGANLEIKDPDTLKLPLFLIFLCISRTSEKGLGPHQ
jgi:hypothetical protein